MKAIRQYYDTYQVVYHDAAGNDLRWDTSVSAFPDWVVAGSESIHGNPAFQSPEYFVFVHGWNMVDFDKRIFAETAFKRLYWQGYHGYFAMFDWPTFKDIIGIGPSGSDPGPVVLSTFNASDFAAYRSATALVGVVKKIRETHEIPSVLGHSMGNTVVSEAMRLWGAHDSNTPMFKNYIASQSAVPSGAFGDSTHQLLLVIGAHDYYQDFPGFMTTAEIANQSHALFGTNGPTASRWLNIYNPDDYALDYWYVNNLLAKNQLAQNVVNQFWPYAYIIPDSPPLESFYRNWRPLRFTRNGVQGVLDVAPFGPTAKGLGPHAYEGLAFVAASDTAPVGKVAMSAPAVPWVNVNLNRLGFSKSMPGGKERPNHSFQFHYDIFTTNRYWQTVFAQITS